MVIRRCEMLIVFALALFCGLLFAQNNADHADWSAPPVRWKTDCAPRGCLMHADVLRGDSGSPANPKDFREYIGVDVALRERLGGLHTSHLKLTREQRRIGRYSLHLSRR